MAFSFSLLSQADQHVTKQVEQLIKIDTKVVQQNSDRVVQLTPEDMKVVQQITAAHSPNPRLVVDENALLAIAQHVLDNATLVATSKNSAGNEAHDQAVTEELALTMQKVGCEMSCNCSGGGDIKGITISVLDALKNYAWDTKLALAFSAFAVSYGEFCLVSQLHATNPLVKSLILLKPLPDISDRVPLINHLITLAKGIIMLIITLIDMPPNDIPHENPAYAEAIASVPTAVYLTIRSIVFCASQSVGLLNVSHEHMLTLKEAQTIKAELSTKLTSIYVHLKTQLQKCYEVIEKIRNNRVYYKLQQIVGHKQNDNMVLIKEIIQQVKVDYPLFSGVDKKKVSLDVLKGRVVILFISSYDIPDVDISDIIQKVGMLEKFTILWLPIVGKEIVANVEEVILQKARTMPWFSLHPSASLHSGVIAFIKDIWKFETAPIMVALDTNGTVVNPNAYSMIKVWGPGAFPFDEQKERHLARVTVLDLSFLVDGIANSKDQWIKGGVMVSFFGGDDIEWVRKFTSTKKEVAKTGGFTLELIYIGKKLRDTILKEGISKCWDDLQVQKFKDRLTHFWSLRMKHGSIKEDNTLVELLKFRSYEGNIQGWTMVCGGTKDILVESGNVMLDILTLILKNNVTISVDNFLTTLVTYKPDKTKDKHCNHVDVPGIAGVVPGNMICVDCHRPMKMVIQYKCCFE